MRPLAENPKPTYHSHAFLATSLARNAWVEEYATQLNHSGARAGEKKFSSFSAPSAAHHHYSGVSPSVFKNPSQPPAIRLASDHGCEVMRVSKSKVQDYFDETPESRRIFAGIISGDLKGFDGNSLVNDHMNRMIAWVFDRIRREVNAPNLGVAGALHFINELSVFARFNSQFLRRAACSVEGHVFELAHEFRRNHLEEGGERGKLPAHYVLYSSALLKDLGVMINGHVPAPPTQMLVFLHGILVDSHCPSTICGMYYSTEGVAIDETQILQSITNRLGELTVGKSGAQLPHLQYYYDLHLDEKHEAAASGVSVEQSHAEGIGRFIRDSSAFGLELPQICDGFLQMTEAMAAWWTELCAMVGEVDNSYSK